MRPPGFAEEAARQSWHVAEATTEKELDFLDHLADDIGKRADDEE
jgi:hypothetical protein